MKVYACYFSENQLNFRLNTVLQFGDSRNIIGASVLINPGSARPISEPDSETISALESITGYGDNWRQFSPDATMRQLAKIFSGWYAGDEKPLNGCILLFNLFNLRDKDLGEALELQRNCDSRHLFSTENDIKRISEVEKIYLGWGNTGKCQLRQYAEPIFDAVKAKCPYLDPDFDKNSFYHPGYINRSYKRNPKTQQLMHDFKNL